MSRCSRALRGAANKVMLAVLAEAILAGSSIALHAEDGLVEAITKGTPSIDARYRFEHVAQDGLPEDANANTLRTQLGYETAPFYDLSVLLEFENITALGGERFNDTVNGKVRFPVVADPEATEINQAYLTFTGVPDTSFRFGRRAINLDNQRFIGSVAFRQNEQSFDSLTLTNHSLPDVEASYSYVFEIQRIFGDDSPMGDFLTQTHLMHLTYDGFALGAVTGYAYLTDLDSDAPRLSSKTFGLRFKGSYPLRDFKLLYTAEFARQSDYADNPADFGLSYLFLEPGLAAAGLTARFGFESLGGDGTSAFQTPHATLHAFQGWADVFLTTPSFGINDFYGRLDYGFGGNEAGGVLDGVKLTGVYHRFDAEDTSAHLGSEWDFEVARPFFDRFKLAFTYANFAADDFGADVEKFWLTIRFKY